MVCHLMEEHQGQGWAPESASPCRRLSGGSEREQLSGRREDISGRPSAAAVWGWLSAAHSVLGRLCLQGGRAAKQSMGFLDRSHTVTCKRGCFLFFSSTKVARHARLGGLLQRLSCRV